jgi:hypothetical protein
MANTEILSVSQTLTGFVKIWQVDPQTGASSLLVDKQNMILKGGAKLIAHALGGDSSAKIWGMYIGYNNDATFLKPDIDVGYSNRFTNYAAPFGYLREPLTFSPNFLSSAGYSENTVLFSTMITSANKAGGADFTEASKIYEVALVAAQDVNDVTKDTVFSRTNFNPVQYNSSYNFTITWGVRILLP